MANQPTKDLDALVKDVIDTQQGLSRLDDLNILFNPPAPNPVSAAPVTAVAVPTPAPTAVAPTASVPLTAEPPKGEPILDLIPDKFKEKDVQAAVSKMSKSYTQLEADLQKEKDEKANMQKILDSLAAPRPAGPAPVLPAPKEDDIQDADFFEKPKDMVTKIVERVSAQKILQYHADMERARYIDGFRAQHADFDQVRGEVLEVLSARPDLDKDQRNLPIVYEMAKQLKVKKMNDLRASLGLNAPIVTPTPTPAPAPEPVDREKMKEEILAVLKAELQRRRDASGIIGGSAPINPSDRLNPAPITKPITEEDRILQEMMDSGPKKLTIDLA
jgi:hypothetical protein